MTCKAILTGLANPKIQTLLQQHRPLANDRDDKVASPQKQRGYENSMCHRRTKGA